MQSKLDQATLGAESSKKPKPIEGGSKDVIDHLGVLSRYLPKSVRGPIAWIAATLLALPILLKLFNTATGTAQTTVDHSYNNAGGFLLVGTILLIVILIGAVEKVVKNRYSRFEKIRYGERLKEITSMADASTSEDLGVLEKDSAIVKSIREEEQKKRPKGKTKADFESRIIAVVSGKGGVGKSLLSLGLLEEFSRDGKALLIDFDLHNRGLTSLLLDSFKARDPGFVIYLLRDFLDEPSLGELLKDYSTNRPESSAAELAESFRKLMLKYSGVEPHSDDRQVKLLGMDSLQEELVKLNDPLEPGNALFLPSIPLGGSFLGSKKIRDASEDAAFLFFKALSYRLRTQNVIQNIIVDCHGAHDLYTVGLIRAATDLVIVTTPDMGSLEGTRELIRFGQQVTDAGGNNIPRSVLVVNRCIDDDLHAQELEDKWKGDLTGGVVRIARDYGVERISRNYHFGSVAAQAQFWRHVEEIKLRLKEEPAAG